MKRALLSFARRRTGGRLLRVLLRHLPGWLPAPVLLNTPTLLAFPHPVPAYRVHFVLVPRPPVEDIDALAGGGAFVAVVRAAQQLAAQHGLPPGWRLVVNTGRFQDVRLLHFHLIVD